MHLVMVHQAVSRLYLALREGVETSLSQEVMVEEELLAVTVEAVVVRLEMGGEVLIMAALVKVFSWAAAVLM